MKLYTVGPVEMFDATLNVAGMQLPYFRTKEFSEIMFDSENLLKKFAGAPNDARVVFLTASGSGAMESTVTGCFTEKDKLLIIAGGSFGERFCQICQYHDIPFESVNLEFGETLTAEHLKSFENRGFTGMLVNIHETSTGQLYDMDMLSEFCKRNGMAFVVDAISSFMADRINVSKSGIDALIFSSQKALALSPGISMILLSKRMISDRVDKIKSKSMYLDIKTHLKDMERGQTPFTPAVGCLLELNEALHRLDAMGLEEKILYTETLAKDFRKRMKAIGITVPGYPLSNALTPLVFDKGATDLYEKLREAGLQVTPTGGALKDKVLRIGHMGKLTIDDNRILAEKIIELM